MHSSKTIHNISPVVLDKIIDTTQRPVMFVTHSRDICHVMERILLEQLVCAIVYNVNALAQAPYPEMLTCVPVFMEAPGPV